MSDDARYPWPSRRPEICAPVTKRVFSGFVREPGPGQAHCVLVLGDSFTLDSTLLKWAAGKGVRVTVEVVGEGAWDKDDAPSTDGPRQGEG